LYKFPQIRWLPACLVIGGIALAFVPPDLTRPVRNLVRDALRPGLSFVRGSADRRASPPQAADSSSLVAALESEIEALRLSLRRQELQSARLRDRLTTIVEQQRQFPMKGSRPSLTTVELLEARVLGEESAQLWRGKQILSAGTLGRVSESSLVLESTMPLVDVGGDSDVAAGDAVYAGRIVIGKIAEVGRYTSTLMLLTDPGYTGRARLARRTARGILVFGPEGTLVADGSGLCQIKHITDPVNVGDEVYTGGTDGLLPYPMYYGKVVRAELDAGAQDWSVWLQPAATLDHLETVLVLRRTMNAERILAN
jgi:cell shape-determining protein MreC